MLATQDSSERITFSLPSSMNLALNDLKKEIKQSKSEIIKLAIENYIAQQRQIKLQKAVEIMANSYENDKGLIEMTQLDAENFV